MHRFAIFVDGSNLFGSLKNMNVQVDDYENFFHHIFEVAVAAWNETIEGGAPPAQLFRVYWYVVGSIDEWDLTDPKAQMHLRDRFDSNREIRRNYMALVGPEMPGARQEEVAKEAWAKCFDEFKEWYERKQSILDGMKRFYHGVRSSTDFIDIFECGHWKVDFITKSVAEKGLDTSIAVDMLALQANYDVAILVSGDADSIPSINYVKNHNKHIAAVEFLPGYPPATRGKGFSSRLKLAADFVIRVYEMNLVSNGIARKDSGEENGT